MAALKVKVERKCFIENRRRAPGDEFVWEEPPDPLPTWASAVVEKAPTKESKKTRSKKEDVDPLS